MVMVWCRRWFSSTLLRERSLAAGLHQTMLLAGAWCGRRSLAGHEVLLARCLSHGAKQNVPPDKKASRLIPRPNIFWKSQTDEVVQLEGLQRIVTERAVSWWKVFTFNESDANYCLDYSVDNKTTGSELRVQTFVWFVGLYVLLGLCVFWVLWLFRLRNFTWLYTGIEGKRCIISLEHGTQMRMASIFPCCLREFSITSMTSGLK